MNTVKIKDYLSVQEEHTVGTAFIPGMLLEFDSNAKLKPHTVEGGPAGLMFALEDELQGGGIDDQYVVDDVAQVWLPTRGDMVYAFLASGENVVVGDFLVSAGDGTLKKYNASAGGWIIGQAMENVDLSGESNSGRIQIRVI